MWMRNNIKEAMRTTVLYLTVLSCALANPSGYYHQEYNYKTSASSYKNNELQHQTDDQGYYRKHGDLEGRVRPKVDANSEHSEYINPNLKNSDYNTGLIGGPNGDLSSYGHMRANVGSYNSLDQSAEGLAHSDHISGARGAYSGYNSGAYETSNYGSGSQSYSMASNLRTMTSRIQQELEQDLQRAIQENRAYSQNNQLEFSELERELRQNLTNRINNELINRYGQQSIRGGLSYTLSGGRLHSTANYDNQELLDLRRNMENSLLGQLRTQYNQAYSSSSRYAYSTTTLRPAYYTHYPTTTYVPYTTMRPQYVKQPSYIRYTPISNPESITTIGTRVQNQLDTRLNQILEDAQRTYFSSSSSYSASNAEALLERLRNELRSNVTYFLEEDIRRNYGTQIQRDGYMYSVGANGETSNQYNYSIRDLENLRAQIERNLIEKLNRDFERYRTSWYQQYRQSSYGSYDSQGSYSEYSSTPRYVIYTTPHTPRYDVYNTPRYNVYDSEVEPLSNRPSSNHLTSLITGSGSSSQSNQFRASGSHQSGYDVSGSREISQLQRQLQQDLSRQLQSALSRGQYGYYSSSGSYNPQSYQVSLQQLTDELNRNLTRQLQEYSSSSHYSTYGNFDQAQLANLRSQLQADLMRQLQQGLQQSYHTSSSYSASSSSSSSSGNYRPTRGFENHQLGQYRSGGNVALLQGEDCVGDDPNAYTNRRMKRSYQPYRSRPIGLSYAGYNNANYNSYRTRPQDQEELGQEVDNSDLTQQVEDPGYGKLQVGLESQQLNNLGQQVDDSDLTQQVESEDLQLGSQAQQQIQQVEDSGFGKLQLGSQQNQRQIGYGQQVDDSDLTQQIETEDLQSGLQGQRQIVKPDDDLTQQVEDDRFGKLQLGSQQSQQIEYGQQEDNSDLTQQVETEDLQVAPQVQHQTEERPVDLTQHIRYDRLGKLQLGHGQNQQPTRYGQQVDNSDLTQVQQSEDLLLGSQTSQYNEERPVVDDLTQQVEDDRLGKLQLGSQLSQQSAYGQQEDISDLTQQVEDADFGGIQVGSQRNHQQPGYGQQEDNSDLTQQTEESGFGQIQIGSHRSPHQSIPSQRSPIDINQDLVQQQTDSTDYGRLQVGSQIQQHTHRGDQELTANQDQLKVGQEIEAELSKQLKTAIRERIYSVTSSGSEEVYTKFLQRLYQDLNNELRRNITKQLQTIALGSGRFSYYKFNNQELNNLQRKLENNLKLEVQREITYITGYTPTTNLEQPTSQVDNFGLVQQPQNPGYLEQQINTDLSQQLENSDLTQQTEDEVENINNLGNSQWSSTPSQVQLIQRLEKQLSDQLKNAISTKYSESYNSYSTSQQIYQQLNDQLARNITNQLQSISTGAGTDIYSYNTYSRLTNKQLTELQKRIENDLKIQLQEEMSLIHNQQNNRQVLTGNEHNLGQTVETDLTQQVEENNLEDNQYTDLTQQNINRGRLQFGHQDIQQPTNLNVLSQQTSDDTMASQFNGQQNTQVTQEQLDLNQQVNNNYPTPLQIPSANLQTNRRPLIRKPVDSNSFLETEINQQQLLHAHDSPHNLPTLNQVIQQNQVNSNEESDTAVPSKIEPLEDKDDLTQQVDQEVDTGLTNSEQTILTSNNQNPNRIPPTNINPIQPQTSPSGQTFAVTNQGQIVTYPQSLTDAEKQADLLIQKLREHNQNNRIRSQSSPDYNGGYTYFEQSADPYASNSFQTKPSQDIVPQYGNSQMYTPYEQRVQYGHQGQIDQNLEASSNIKPLPYQHANVVQNVESPVGSYSNVGVKGRRYRPQSELSPPPRQPISVLPPQTSVVIPPQPLPGQPAEISPEVSLETSTITQDESGIVAEENLPWWKRFGHKVKQGAQNFKEKYIG